MQVIGTTPSVQFPNTLCYLSSIKYDRHNFNKNCWNNRWFECSGETKLCFSHTLFAGHQDYSNLKRDFNNTCCLSWRSKNQEKAKNFVMEVNKKVSSRHFFLKKKSCKHFCAYLRSWKVNHRGVHARTAQWHFKQT